MGFPTESRKSGHLTESDYRAFLLRCWREEEEGPDSVATWRFCLVKPGDGESQRAFAGLADLMVFLQQELKLV